MEIENFLLNLSRSYREGFTALVLTFPMAYIDCLRLSERFGDLDMIPQIFTAAGIAVILVLYGAFFHAMCRVYANADNIDVFLVGILFPTFIPNLFTAMGTIRTRTAFVVFTICVTLFMSLCVLVFVRRKRMGIADCKKNPEDADTDNNKPT